LNNIALLAPLELPDNPWLGNDGSRNDGVGYDGFTDNSMPAIIDTIFESDEAQVDSEIPISSPLMSY
jgi:hypothetical protein